MDVGDLFGPLEKKEAKQKLLEFLKSRFITMKTEMFNLFLQKKSKIQFQSL